LCAQLVFRASNLLSQTVNKSTVLSLPLDISQNWLLQRTLTDTEYPTWPQGGIAVFDWLKYANIYFSETID